MTSKDHAGGLSSREVVQALRTCDDADLERHLQHNAAMSAVLARLTAKAKLNVDPATAEDLAMETLLMALRKIESLTNEDAALGWLNRILRNMVTDHLRRMRWTWMSPSISELQVSPPRHTEPEEIVTRQELREMFLKFKGTLSAAEKVALQDMLDGLKPMEAAKLGGGRGTVQAIRMRYCRIRKRVMASDEFRAIFKNIRDLL